jgi:hypothetical protein
VSENVVKSLKLYFFVIVKLLIKKENSFSKIIFKRVE